MAKKYYKLLQKINGDQFSNISAGLENEDVFGSVSAEPFEAIEEVNKEVATQLEDADNLFSEVEIEEDELDTDNDDEWRAIEAEEEDRASRKPEDCINIMELVSLYTNNYRKNFVSIVDDSLVDLTGDFTKNPLYVETEKMFETITSVLNDHSIEYYANLSIARELLVNKKKMTMICGTSTAPFIYEGIQLAYIQQLHNIILALPYVLRSNGLFENAIESIGIDKDIKFLNRILKDISDAKDVLGTKIIFKEAVKSEITGRSNEINETVYADSDLISEGHDTIVAEFEYAGESIANLIDIKANNALLEYNLIIRDLSLLVTYLEKYGPKDNWGTIRTTVYSLLEEENSEGMDELLTNTCKTLDKVLVDMNKAYKTILKKED